MKLSRSSANLLQTITRMPTDDDARRDAVDSGGSFAFENWRAAENDLGRGDAFEYPLYSDARIVGEATFGPYMIVNPIADRHSQVALVLRSETHVSWSYADMSATDTARYHGGTESDEVAALLSLALGCRLKAGDPTRWFEARGDPRGRPWSFRSSGRSDPLLPNTPPLGPLIPQLVGERNIVDAEPLLRSFIHIDPPASVALVRAARLYQDAVWLSESEPALTWLMLVSAIEVAANHWRSANETERERLHASEPTVERLLVAAGGDELANQVAALIVHSLGATGKFIAFCMRFLPVAPEPRPEAVSARLPWQSRTQMKQALSTIYEYRSDALHAGIPFPAPMCSFPFPGREHAERLGYGAIGAFGGIWRHEDIPMFLHTFEYIARGALTSWWAHLPQRSAA